MTQDFKIRPQDVAAYIVFQFKGLTQTLAAYGYHETAQSLQLLQAAFLTQVFSQQSHTNKDKK